MNHLIKKSCLGWFRCTCGSRSTLLCRHYPLAKNEQITHATQECACDGMCAQQYRMSRQSEHCSVTRQNAVAKITSKYIAIQNITRRGTSAIDASLVHGLPKRPTIIICTLPKHVPRCNFYRSHTQQMFCSYDGGLREAPSCVPVCFINKPQNLISLAPFAHARLTFCRRRNSIIVTYVKWCSSTIKSINCLVIEPLSVMLECAKTIRSFRTRKRRYFRALKSNSGT